MSISKILRSAATAWLVGVFLLGGLSAFAYSLVGWVGVGIIGLAGLVISTNSNLHAGHPLLASNFRNDDAPMYARQPKEAQKSQTSHEQKMAAAAVRAERSRALYLINTVLIAMTALGFGLFIFHQL